MFDITDPSYFLTPPTIFIFHYVFTVQSNQFLINKAGLAPDFLSEYPVALRTISEWLCKQKGL